VASPGDIEETVVSSTTNSPAYDQIQGIVLIEAQAQGLKKKKGNDPAYFGSQDLFYNKTIKEVGRICQ
jgi:hypothetical protein